MLQHTGELLLRLSPWLHVATRRTKLYRYDVIVPSIFAVDVTLIVMDTATCLRHARVQGKLHLAPILDLIELFWSTMTSRFYQMKDLGLVEEIVYKRLNKSIQNFSNSLRKRLQKFISKNVFYNRWVRKSGYLLFRVQKYLLVSRFSNHFLNILRRQYFVVLTAKNHCAKFVHFRPKFSLI